MACDVQSLVTDAKCEICAFGSIEKGAEIAMWCKYVNMSAGGQGSILGEGTGERIQGEGAGEWILEE